MLPKPYATHVTVLHALVAIVIAVCATIATALGSVSGDALIGLYSGIVGYVLGGAGMVIGANGAAARVEQAVWRGVADAMTLPEPPPNPERRGLRVRQPT